MRALTTIVLLLGLAALPATSAGAQESGFDDLGDGVHRPAIEALAERGITQGCREDRYCPQRDLTRGEMAKLLVEAFDLELGGPDAFPDDDGTLFERWIDTLAAAGITQGCDDQDGYCPRETVTRAQMATFLSRAQRLSDGVEVFADDEASPLEQEIEEVAAAGITAGCAEFRFCPSDPVSRAETATLLARSRGLVQRVAPPPARARLEGVRLVALYGRPDGPGLGVLGEQDVDGAIARARDLAAQYEGLDGLTPRPALEVITTLATAAATSDGDYSQPLPDAVLRRWIDAAADADVDVVLDLQPGLTDFLTQAQQLEEFLAEPHVGLALDPEWRLAPGERHLEQIGSVSIEEVNATGEWFADLAEREGLPQQLFLVHQFRFDMIQDRERLDTWPELRTVIQMDGQGTQERKLSTWEALTADPPGDAEFGWKNFYDEDPTLRSPRATAALRPDPVFVSYQ